LRATRLEVLKTLSGALLQEGCGPYNRLFVQAVFYREKNGREPVNDFIDRLSPERQEEIDHTISLLNRLAASDPPLPFPYSSQVDGQLRELRCHYGRELYRVLYRRSRNLFVLLHALEKHTRKIPQADIDIANARWTDFQTRMNAERKRPPRPAARDAP